MTNQAVVDFHMHTTYSDGQLSVSELLDKAVSLGLKAIAITDHDNMNGVAKAQELIKEKSLPIQLVSGVEISCYDPKNKTNVHLLAYFIDPSNKVFNKFLETLQKKRLQRNLALIEHLNQQGFNLTQPLIWSLNELKSISRLNIAQAMVDRKYASSVKEVFLNQLNDRTLRYIETPKTMLKEAIVAVAKSGGTSIIAHPGLMKCSNSELVNRLTQYIEYGLKGVEVFHPTHSLQVQHLLLNFCETHSLEYSHGSDFHGTNKPICILGESYCLIKGVDPPFISSFLQEQINML